MVQSDSLLSIRHFREKALEKIPDNAMRYERLITGSTPVKAKCLPVLFKFDIKFNVLQALDVAVSGCAVNFLNDHVRLPAMQNSFPLGGHTLHLLIHLSIHSFIHSFIYLIKLIFLFQLHYWLYRKLQKAQTIRWKKMWVSKTHLIFSNQKQVASKFKRTLERYKINLRHFIED